MTKIQYSINASRKILSELKECPSYAVAQYGERPSEAVYRSLDRYFGRKGGKVYAWSPVGYTPSPSGGVEKFHATIVNKSQNRGGGYGVMCELDVFL